MTLMTSTKKLVVQWYQGNPGGYTDDLGIIADCNQYIAYRPPGWYILTGNHYYTDIASWCKLNLQSYREYDDPTRGPVQVILDENDVVLFKLRWF